MIKKYKQYLEKNIGTLHFSWKICLILIFAIGIIHQAHISKYTFELDHGMWAEQAMYVSQNSPIQYDPLLAYGHPGGPIILATLAIKNSLRIGYYDAVTVVLILFNTILIGLLTYVLYLLFPKLFFWKLIPFILFYHFSYSYNTPPSMVMTFLVPLQCFYTLYLCKKEKLCPKDILLFSLLSGFAVATRADIGGLISLIMGILLVKKISWKEVLLIIVLSFLTFYFLDPFMYSMPIQHIKDIFNKMFFHYHTYGYTSISYERFFIISINELISMGIILVLLYKQRLHFIKKKWVYTILGITLFLHILYLSSDYKAERYFLPIITVWEILFLACAESTLKCILKK